MGDANYAGSWKTVVVGAAGAGGRSIFALDVTNPSNFSTSSKLWEISDPDSSLSTAIRNNIGHVLGKPVIVPVKNAAGAVTWKAIFGNGYNSR
ncbi:PilC/PilY family type IV pilus protein, partial [Pseudomonas aeruginosa]|uniref:PilC/PilY family type IV pilus protein n=1 Tax=Pseudomonas aeruginosa TaxID=287 RepID=UPI0034E23EDC